MIKYLSILITICNLMLSNAQNCLDFTTSKYYDFEIVLLSKDENKLGKAEIVIGIFDRMRNKKIQTIQFESEFILKSESFKNCENNKSYQADEYLKSIENDFGDFIIADLNFDGKEDIAIKREEGGNGGPLYFFYIQSENQQFVHDQYLSSQISYFPNYINSKEKTLHVYVRVNSFSDEGITYLYNDEKKIWSIAKILTSKN